MDISKKQIKSPAGEVCKERIGAPGAEMRIVDKRDKWHTHSKVSAVDINSNSTFDYS